jgi:hypothetical protein
MSQTSRRRFGIMTAPSQVEYDDVLRVWREADMIPEIEHARVALRPPDADLREPGRSDA